MLIFWHRDYPSTNILVLECILLLAEVVVRLVKSGEERAEGEAESGCPEWVDGLPVEGGVVSARERGVGEGEKKVERTRKRGWHLDGSQNRRRTP